jgi:hypothetical protein
MSIMQFMRQVIMTARVVLVTLVKPRRLVDNLTYANVAATLALFISLGGVSYATLALPADSVGSKQLRAGAVGLGALQFSLGTVGVSDRKVEDLIKNGCNGGGFSGNVAPDCLPSRLDGPTPGREVRIRCRHSGPLMVSAILNLKNEGAPQTTAHVEFSLNIDNKNVSVSQVNLVSGQIVQVPLQALVNASVGWHTVRVEVAADYTSSTPGDVVVSEASVIASALPGIEASK